MDAIQPRENLKMPTRRSAGLERRLLCQASIHSQRRKCEARLPYTYLHDVLTRLPSMTNHQIEDIVPKTWAAAAKNLTLRAA